MAFSKTSLLATALLAIGSVSAQSTNASYTQVADIQLTFPAADLTPVPVPASWLDIQGVLNVTFGNTAVSNIGDKLTVAQVQTAPTFRISSETPAAANNSVFGSGKRFTVAFLDAVLLVRTPAPRFSATTSATTSPSAVLTACFRTRPLPV